MNRRGAGASGRSIVQVTLWNSPYLGNFMTSELALANEVRAQLGLATHFVLADGAAGQPWLADIDAAEATWSVLPARLSAWRERLDRVARERGAALIHAHFTAADLPAASVAAARGVPCVWHIHTGFEGYALGQRMKDALKMRIIARRRVARIIVVSPWLEALARRRGAPGDRIDVVPNAIALERFAELPPRASARERFGLSEDAEVILGLGWWPKVKGVDVLLDAMESVARGHPSVVALLVGEEQLRSFLSERHPQPPAWLRVSGFVGDSAWLYAAADVFVSASRHEGQSSAIGEALACGLEVVMSDIRGTAGWSGAPGLLTFPSGDAGALAARLEELLDTSRRERAAAGARSREWVSREFAIDAWCERMCSTYRSLV